MKSRRAVGGLISLVALIVVFGVIATAFITLTGEQAHLSSTNMQIAEMENDKRRESLEFSVVSCTRSSNPNYSDTIILEVNNTGSDAVKINSVFFQNLDSDVNRIASASYFPHDGSIRSLESKNIILSQDYKIVITDSMGSVIADANSIMLVTLHGNKYSITYDFETQCT